MLADAAFDAGVSALGQRHGVSMTFAFEVLDEQIRPDAMPDDAALLASLERPVRAVEAMAA